MNWAKKLCVLLLGREVGSEYNTKVPSENAVPSKTMALDCIKPCVNRESNHDLMGVMKGASPAAPRSCI